MRLAAVLPVVWTCALLACASAPIGSLDGNDVPLPDRAADEAGDAGTGAAPRTGSTTAVVLTVNLVGAGTVTSAPTGLTCTATACTGIFAPGTAVSLAAEPTGGAAFAGWSGACTGATCTVTLASSTAVTATFASLSGTWAGTYANTRSKNNCTFNNKGNLTLTTTASGDAGATVGLAATMDGLEIRNGGCGVTETVNGATSPRNNDAASVAAGTLTGTWVVNAGGFGNLDFPFKATISGSTMTGSWTCPGCTGAFTLTKKP